MRRTILIGLVIICFVLIVWNIKREQFDTYWNHSIGVQDIYKKSKNSDEQVASKHIADSETLAGYTWAARSPNGMQIYDHYYDKVLLDGQMDQTDPTYFRRDLESDYLDSKFQTMNTVPQFNDNMSDYAHYNISDMLEQNPLYTVYNGEYISLSQKTF
jgi:hypothetical protein